MTSKKRGCGVLVIHDQHVLLLRRGDTAPTCPGMWGAPGGLQDVGETDSETAARELYEEAGVQAELSGAPFYECRWHEGDHRELRYFYVPIRERPIVALRDGEASEYGWFSFQEACELPLAFHYRAALERLRCMAVL